MEKATIYDYARICKNIKNCEDCPLGVNSNRTGISCSYLVREIPDRANEIILKWCKEHPVETRQDKFLKMFPKARTCNGVIDICPISFGGECSVGNKCCSECKKEYWLAEVEENE